jgi:SAM-dependent methyltransferase
VLEIGCGAGSSTLVHAKEVRRLVATDVSRGMVERARGRTARRSFADRTRFALVDAGDLPFQDASFDAVIGRGVALSYVRDLRQTLREIRRVLRPGGHVVIDAMNEGSSSSSGRGFRAVQSIGGKPACVDQSNQGRFQVRRVFYLRPKARLARLARGSKVFKSRPRDLPRQTLRMEQVHARHFPQRTLRRLAKDAVLSTVEIVPLGQRYLLLMSENKELRGFVARNRRTLSRLALELRTHFRASRGFHLMLIATKPRV